MGGGAAGTISAPAYMTVAHAWLLDADRQADNAAVGHAYSEIGLMNVYDDMFKARGGPYGGSEAYDPTEVLDDLEVELEAFDTYISGMTPLEDWQENLEAIIQRLDRVIAEPDLLGFDFNIDPGSVGTVSDITVSSITVQALDLPSIDVAGLVSAFTNRQNIPKAKSKAQFAAGRNSINAVMSSAFVIGMALIETEHLYQIEDFDAKLTQTAQEQELQAELQGQLDQRRLDIEAQGRKRELELEEDLDKRKIEAAFDEKEFSAKMQLVEKNHTSLAELTREYLGLRVQAYTAGLNGIAALIGIKATGMAEDVKHELAFAGAKIDSERQQTDRNLEIDHLDFTWNLNLYLYFANFMSSIAGSQHVIPNKPSVAGKVMGAAGAVLGGLGG